MLREMHLQSEDKTKITCNVSPDLGADPPISQNCLMGTGPSTFKSIDLANAIILVFVPWLFGNP